MIKYFLVFMLGILMMLIMSISSKELSTKSSLINIIDNNIIRFVPYRFELSLEDTSNVVLESEGINFGKNSEGEFRFNVTHSDYIKAYKVDENGSKALIDSVFITANDPPYTIFLKGKRSGFPLKADQFKDANLKVTFLNYGINPYFTIQSFDMLTFDNGELVMLSTEGSKISDEQYDIIKNAKHNQPVIFKVKIKDQHYDGNLLDPVVYFITK